MLPSVSPYEVLRASGWRSALLTTFSLSLSFFEAVPLHALRKSGAQNIAILADLAGYQASLAEAGVSDVGRTYDLVPLKVSGGCFHPKIMLLDGADGPHATVGSGNLTFGGWGHNIETLDLLVPSHAPLAFADLADFLDHLGMHIEEERIAATGRPAIVEAMAEACRRSARVSGGGRTRVIHTFDAPIIEQLAMHADALGGATEVTVLSPYFGGPEAVLSLARALRCERIRVAVTGRAPEFFNFGAALGMRIEPVRSDAFRSTALLHAKIIEIVCRHGRLTLAGSANATTPALVTSANVEVSVLRVVDDRLSFGWLPTDPMDPAHGEGGDPDPTGGACLAARFEEGAIRGRAFGVSNAGGTWNARVVSGTLHAALGAASLAPDGTFVMRPGATLPIRDLFRSTQLVLARDATEIRGWLVFDHVLGAVRERGPVAEAMLRTLAGAEEPEDLALILSFFVANPAAFLQDDVDAPIAGERGGRPVDAPGGMVDLADLRPIDAFADDVAAATPGAGASAFERLLASLRRHVRESAPSRRGLPDAGDLGDTVQGNSDETDTLPRWRVDEVVDALAAFVEALPRNEPEFRRHSVSLLDFVLFAAERSAEPEALRAEYVQRWVGIVREAGAARDETDVLDRAYVAVLASWVLADRARAGRVHAWLQAWRRGPLEADWVAAVTPRRDGVRERRLWGIADEGDWAEAIRLITSTRTSWMNVHEVRLALAGAGSLPALPEALAAEAAILDRVLRGLDPPRRIAALPARTRWPACQRCFMRLPSTGQERLREHRIALARCCDVVLLDPWLE